MQNYKLVHLRCHSTIHNQISVLRIANKINKPGCAFERRPQHWKVTKHDRVQFELFVSPFENVLNVLGKDNLQCRD